MGLRYFVHPETKSGYAREGDKYAFMGDSGCLDGDEATDQFVFAWMRRIGKLKSKAEVTEMLAERASTPFDECQEVDSYGTPLEEGATA